MSSNGIEVERAPRARRNSVPPSLKIAGSVVAIIMLLITGAGIVWGAAVLVTSKADIDTVHEIEKDVEVIKTEQRMLIRAIRPELPVGEE